MAHQQRQRRRGQERQMAALVNQELQPLQRRRGRRIDLHAALAVNPLPNNTLPHFIDMHANVPADELGARRIAMLLDAPNEPPFNNMFANEIPRRNNVISKNRSFFTMAKYDRPEQMLRPALPALTVNFLNAVQVSKPMDSMEFFINFHHENLSSKKYPNGYGLPQHWGIY